VAALARAAGRPVKVVFNRAEEFLAPDHHRNDEAHDEQGDGHLEQRESLLRAKADDAIHSLFWLS